jgi:predicted nucleotide-binding protein
LTAPFTSALIPLPDKVFNLMWECNCAIINVSADTEKKQGDVFGINENVIAELWGAFLHYKKRVILVIDSRLKDKLPSMMQGLTAIFYEGDKLAWDDGIRLQKALDEFRNQL